MRTVEEYLALPYRILLTPDADEEGASGWVAEVVELDGCISQGETPQAAVARIRDAMEGWVAVALEEGKAIPEPRGEDDYSGRFLLRLPSSLHAELARQADRKSVV